MNNTILVKSSAGKEPVLTLNAQKACELGLSKVKRTYVSFGMAKNFVELEITDTVPQNQFLLPKDVIDDLRIPEYPVYEVCVDGNEIILGPCIGMLVCEDDQYFTKPRLRGMKVYAKQYENLHGALIIFALNQVDPDKKLVTGYCYDPVEDRWRRGTFPYPSSIYRMIGLSEFWHNHFLSNIGDRFFNSYYFNKWDMYKWFSTHPELNRYLPYTILYKSYKQIPDLLNKYGSIFIKPISGLGGHGVVKVSMQNESMVIKFRESGKNRTITLSESDKIKEFFKKRFSPGRYLAQQAINLLEYKGSIIDFRCAVQKDQSGKWVCHAVIGRLGDKDSVVSNISSGGSTYEGVELLKLALPLSDKGILDIKKKIEDLALKASAALDEFGLNCANLGLDVGIDINRHLWIFEINNRYPSPRYAIDLDDMSLYNTLKTSPLLYAKALAGFGLKR